MRLCYTFSENPFSPYSAKKHIHIHSAAFNSNIKTIAMTQQNLTLLLLDCNWYFCFYEKNEIIHSNYIILYDTRYLRHLNTSE